MNKRKISEKIFINPYVCKSALSFGIKAHGLASTHIVLYLNNIYDQEETDQ